MTTDQDIFRNTLEDHSNINPRLLDSYSRVKGDPGVRQTHNFHGRFENIYIDLALIPELTPVVDRALALARQQLKQTELKYGFWFNEMQPGHVTSLHDHDNLDELLSCVYYITAPTGSGDLLLHLDNKISRMTPEAGDFLFFPPSIPHEVEENRSNEARLSVAFNFGPNTSDAFDE